MSQQDGYSSRNSGNASHSKNNSRNRSSSHNAGQQRYTETSSAYVPAIAGGQNGGHGKHGKPPEKKRRSTGWRVVFWAALIVLVAALIALGVIGYSYWQGQQTYKDVATTAAADLEGKSLADMTVDWDALRAMNPDTVAWIYMPGTVINYPVVQTTDNDKYLWADFLGGTGAVTHFGTIFLSAENSADFSDPNSIIYGHNMNDGSMFATFNTLLNSDEFNAHRTIYILTPNGNYMLDSFTIIECAADDPLAQVQFSSDEEFLSYMQDKVNRSMVTPNPAAVGITDMNQIFTFATCTNTYQDTRAVLFAYIKETTVPGVAAAGSGNDSVGEQDIENVDNAIKEMA